MIGSDFKVRKTPIQSKACTIVLFITVHTMMLSVRL